MADKQIVSRRALLKSTCALGATVLPSSLFAMPDVALDPHIELLSSTSGITIPPRGRTYFKFSFDFPEPSVRFADLLASVRVYTTENAYSLDPSQIHITETQEGLEVVCTRLTWAGGQEACEGLVRAYLRNEAGCLSINVDARVPGKNLKSVAVILRWLPHGEISRAGGRFIDYKDDEFLASWPNFNAGLVSPIIVLRSGSRYTSVSMAARKDEARTCRFYLQPGAEGYRAELVYEREAWNQGDSLSTPSWCLRHGDSYDAVARPHYQHVEEAFGLKSWETRQDIPDWMRKTSLVVAIHGAHWTGYIFNTYARQLSILRWIAEQIDPAQVMVFLPAWDGRYYWNYPEYKPDPRMGGVQGFRALIDGAHRLGFHLVAMFGANVANKYAASYPAVQDALTVKTNGNHWNLDFVDWDNDREGDANYGFMNLGVASWRDHLESRITETLERFQLDGYFLDIVGVAENNQQADMYLGTRDLVGNLRRKFPDKLAVGEMHYDALLGSIAVYQADVTPEYPEAFYKYGRMFEHLSWPAPGRGSTGVHEYGFSGRGTLPREDQRIIPTLTIVDDTFSNRRQDMLAVIEIAKRWNFPTK